jgi:carbon monoxide dehydrogenase subunit G
MPGAEVLERVSDDAYKIAVRVKVGPMSMQYRGQVEIVERDGAAWQATMRARATEARGQGTADAQIHMGLQAEDQGTRATVTTELQMSGRAAAMGRGVIVDVAQKLVELFAANLAQMLAAEPAAMTGSGGDGAVAGADAPSAPATASVEPVPDASPQPDPPAAAGPAPPVVPAPAPAAEPSLPVMQIAASVVGSRLSNPRTLLIALGGLAALFGGFGYLLGRRR